MYFIRPWRLALAVCAGFAASASAANIMNVVETGGDNEPTDTITAKWSGQSWNVTVDNEPVPGVTVGQSYTAGLFGDLAPAYVDRNHRYANDPAGLQIPGYLIGQEYILSGNDNRDNVPYRLDVTIAEPSTVFMLIDNRLSDTNGADPPTFDATHMQWILDQGWAATDNGLNRSASTSVPDEVPIDEGADGTINQWFSVYEKRFLAGTFSLLQADNGGQNMYGVVVIPDGELVVGDVNGDRVVDILDFGIIRDNFRTGTTPSDGDLNFDGSVDFDDFQIWKTAFGGGGPASVPEPGALALLGVALLGAVMRRFVGYTRRVVTVLAVAAVPFPATGATIVNVVETGGDAEATDTILAKWSGQTWPVTVANEPVPGAVIGQNFTAGLFGHQAPAFVDRNHRYTDVTASNTLPIPPYLVGQEYILSGNDNRDNPTYKLDVTISTSATVYMLIDNRLSDASNANPPTFDATHMQWILDQGWIATANGLNRNADPSVPDEVAFDEGADDTVNQWYSVYMKEFAAGTFSLLQPDNAGQNMYGVVVRPGAAAVAGDVNGDQVVDIDDFDIIRANFRIGTTPEQGDLDFSGLVDLNDFKIWKNAFGGGGPASVPEPAAWALVVIGGIALAAYRAGRRCTSILVVMLALSTAVASAQSTIRFDVNGAADWNLQSSWIDPVSLQNFIPGDNYPDEVPGINNGGTAFLSSAALFPVGGVIVAETGGSSGRLEIRNGGSLNVVPATAPAANGSVIVGQSGTGVLSLLGNGALNATSLTVGGGTGSALEASGTAKIAISGNANLARNTRLVGPNVDFDVGGTLSVSGVFQPTINGPNASVIAVGGNVNVGGRLDVTFDGVTPAFGNSWLLVNAADANGRFTSVTSNTALPRGLVLEQSIDAGGSGDVAVRVGNRLVLSVDRGTGATTISNVAGGPINFDGYAIGSAGGSLSAAQWDSLEDQNVGDWLEAAPTAENLSELNPFGGSNLLVGQTIDLGSPYQFVPTEFGQSGDDVTFDYSTASGEVFQGIVEYTGPHNTLVLVVNPDTGVAVIQNQSPFSASIDGYTVASASGSLRFTNGTWESLQDQAVAGWEEANPSANFLSELNPTGSTLFAGGQTVDLGSPFDINGKRDLTFEFHLTSGESLFGAVEYGEPISVGQNGDTDNDGDVDLDDLNAVRNNFGSAGPVGGTTGDAYPYDGLVNLDDLNAVRNNFGATAGSESVPEPSAWGLAAVFCAIGGWAARRKGARPTGSPIH